MLNGPSKGSHDKAPIAIFTCRRPNHLSRLLTSLLKNKEIDESELNIFVGGPKKYEDWVQVEKVLDIAQDASSKMNIRILERFDAKTGSDLIKGGITEILSSRENVICLEDDLIVRDDFLAYMNQALIRYSEEERVAAISGWNFGLMEHGKPSQTYLFPCTTSWGWATWRRSWEPNPNVQLDFEWLTAKSSRIHKFNFNETYNCLSMIERILKDNYDAWDAAWYLHCFRRSLLTVFPNSSLIVNSGFDGSGLNFKRSYEWKKGFDEDPQEIFAFPEEIILSRQFTSYIKGLRSWVQSFWPDSNLKFFVDRIKRKRRQHLNYFKRRFYF